MTQPTIDYRSLARLRVEQLEDEDGVLRTWLFRVRVLGWPLLGLALVCPVAVGSMSASEALGGKRAWIVALVSFAGAAAIALHRGLHCETYQQALKRTIQSVRSIVEEFEAISAVPEPDLPAAFAKAEARLRELRATSEDLPPKRRRRLDQILGTNAPS
jgi:hypothetical protein